MTQPTIVDVLPPVAVDTAYSYRAPPELDLRPGDFVAMPLGPRTAVGVVWATRTGDGANLKSVIARKPWPPLSAPMRDFVDWIARWTLSPRGAVLRMAARTPERIAPPPPRLGFSATGEPPAKLTPARQRVLAALAGGAPLAKAELAAKAGCSGSVIDGLVADGALAALTLPPEPIAPLPDPDHAPRPLEPDQATAADILCEAVKARAFAPFLLEGVTGSGKTEVYFEAIAAALRAGRQTLVMTPEIALTAQFLDRFAARFGVSPAEWHSGVTARRRERLWGAAASGEARVVVGARSALFLPFANLKLIVVDEEHDGSYKQEDGFIYHARDLAVARARIEACAAILVSATPSLETLWNAQGGRYRWLRLADRHGAAVLPKIALIDLHDSPPEPGRWLSPVLTSAMAEALARGEQSLLFLNRRGYAPLVLCRACGERMKAPDSDSWLVEHRYSGRLVCHLTGFSMMKPDRCPHCGAKDALVSIGPGVERVEEEARLLFPDARLAVFSSDTVADAAAARDMIGAMEAGALDIMVATQAAAKGHNFPFLTLVGVVDADLGLRGGDLRAAERTFQLLTQVSGRAGRRDRPGQALIQTWAPEHPVMRALIAGDRDAFVAVEMAEREAAGLPPFGRLAAVIVSGSDAAVLEAYVRALAAAAPNAEGVDVFGPADAPLSLVRGRRRKRFLVRAERGVDVQGFLAAWRARLKPPASVRLTLDVDPYSFL